MLSVRRWPADRPRIAASITGAIVASASLGTFGCTGRMADPVRIRFAQAPQLCHEWRRNGAVRSIATYRAWRLRISGFDGPEPVFVASPAASTNADIGPPAVISNVGSPRRPGRGRTGSVSWGRDGTPHQPFSSEGPARRRWQNVARNALSAVAWPTFKSVRS